MTDHQIFYTWIFPIALTAAGCLYALWAVRTYDRAMDKIERERAAAAQRPAAE